MTVELLNGLDHVRRSINGSSCRQKRSEIGQFLTPASIARFMASLLSYKGENIRILDPGAGAGVLFAACVDILTSRDSHVHSIEVVAYENDSAILSVLGETMRCCEESCQQAGIVFRCEIRPTDFVEDGLARTQEGLFSVQHEWFTHAILNPPYKKINAQSKTRKLLDAGEIEVSNLYAAFVWLASRMLEPGGELVAITPRSFCNGPYFRRFRRGLLNIMSLRQIHVFDSRKKAFGDDGVLQENIIYYAIKEPQKPDRVLVSSSHDASFERIERHNIPYERMVVPEDQDVFIHLIQNNADAQVMEQMKSYRTSLEELCVEVSTGRVVDFRAREHLRTQPNEETSPLIYPCHFKGGFVSWPIESCKKPNAIRCSEITEDLLVPSGYYVLTKRFSSKEERRRVVAAVYDPSRVESSLVGFENHLNYFHIKGKGLPPNLAKGLALYLNSSHFDRYFRLFSGHTQVNATDLRKMGYPCREQLLRLGKHLQQRMPDQTNVDAILDAECTRR